jgi:hypothetical protein
MLTLTLGANLKKLDANFCIHLRLHKNLLDDWEQTKQLPYKFAIEPVMLLIMIQKINF